MRVKLIALVVAGLFAHTAQADACLGMKVEDTAAFTEALGKACGKHVELRFTRIL